MEAKTEEVRLELQEKRFFNNITVRTWKREGTYWSIAPWLFAIQKDGEKEHGFGGVPNYCATRHTALMRAWHRDKWLANGDWDKHYKSM